MPTTIAMKRIELFLEAYETSVLPLNYIAIKWCSITILYNRFILITDNRLYNYLMYESKKIIFKF